MDSEDLADYLGEIEGVATAGTLELLAYTVMSVLTLGAFLCLLSFGFKIAWTILTIPLSPSKTKTETKERQPRVSRKPVVWEKEKSQPAKKPSKAETHLTFMENSLAQAGNQLDEVRRSFESYQNDIALALKAPLLSMETDSQVQDFVLELADLVLLKDYAYQLEDFKEPRDVPFIARTRKLVQTFKHLERRALGQRPSNWGDKEARLVEQAMALLAKAQDERNHVSERQLSYERVFKIMEELTIPRTPTMIRAIESSGLTLELEV